jgi:hypothetical protein
VRIQGELLKLGINVSATTVATVLRVSGLGPAPPRIGPSWSEFLRAEAQSMLGPGLPSASAGGLEGNESARSAATAEAACGVVAEELSTTGAEKPWSSPPVPGRPRLSAVAAVPPPCDPPAAPLRSSQQWHARDGPKHAGTLCTAQTARTGWQAVGRARPPCELLSRVGFPGGLRDSLHPSRAPQQAEHRFRSGT